MTDKPRKRGRKPMAPEDKKQSRSLKFDPDVIAFLESLERYQMSKTVNAIVRRSKPFKDWKRDQG